MGDLRLRELRRHELRCLRRFTPEGRQLWAAFQTGNCPWCGGSPYARTEQGGFVDGEPLICLACGEVGSIFADEGGVVADWAGDRQALRPSALAGLRRLLGESRASWWEGVRPRRDIP